MDNPETIKTDQMLPLPNVYLELEEVVDVEIDLPDAIDFQITGTDGGCCLATACILQA